MKKPRRSRRLRKKLHVDEFQQFGFEMDLRMRSDLGEEASVSFWDDFILEAIEASGLMFGGGESGFVCGFKRSATAQDRAQVEAWLRKRGEVLEVVLGPLVDVWH